MTLRLSLLALLLLTGCSSAQRIETELWTSGNGRKVMDIYCWKSDSYRETDGVRCFEEPHPCLKWIKVPLRSVYNDPLKPDYYYKCVSLVESTIAPPSHGIGEAPQSSRSWTVCGCLDVEDESTCITCDPSHGIGEAPIASQQTCLDRCTTAFLEECDDGFDGSMCQHDANFQCDSICQVTYP